METGCGDCPGETLEEIDETICNCFPDCPVRLAYTFACQAVHLRDRLKMYEDTGLFPEQIKERLAMLPPNAPLTLAELWEMDGEPVYLDWGGRRGEYALVRIVQGEVSLRHKNGILSPAKLVFECAGQIYCRKPEEVAP